MVTITRFCGIRMGLGVLTMEMGEIKGLESYINILRIWSINMTSNHHACHLKGIFGLQEVYEANRRIFILGMDLGDLDQS